MGGLVRHSINLTGYEGTCIGGNKRVILWLIFSPFKNNRMKNIIILLLSLALVFGKAHAQSIGIGTATPNSSV
jgi:hypothetical protein